MKTKQRIPFLFLLSALFVAILVVLPIRVNAANPISLKNNEIVTLKKSGAETYSFSVKTDSKIQFKWSGNNNHNFYLAVYSDKSRTKIIENIFPSEASGNFYLALKNGTYYVDMYDGAGSTYTPTTKVKYTATYVTKINKDNYCRGKAVELKSKTYAQIVQTPNYDYDRWYKITLPKNQKVTIAIPNGGGSYALYVYSSSFVQSKFSWNSSTKKMTSTDILAKGTYYIHVPAYGSYSQAVRGKYMDFQWK